MKIDMRQVINAIFYVVCNGCRWADLPHDYPNFNTVYYYFRKWCQNGTWEQIHVALRHHVRHANGRKSQPSAAIIDHQGSQLLLQQALSLIVKRLERIGADGGYRGQLVNWVYKDFHLTLDIVLRSDTKPIFYSFLIVGLLKGLLLG